MRFAYQAYKVGAIYQIVFTCRPGKRSAPGNYAGTRINVKKLAQ